MEILLAICCVSGLIGYFIGRHAKQDSYERQYAELLKNYNQACSLLDNERQSFTDKINELKITIHVKEKSQQKQDKEIARLKSLLSNKNELPQKLHDIFHPYRYDLRTNNLDKSYTKPTIQFIRRFTQTIKRLENLQDDIYASIPDHIAKFYEEGEKEYRACEEYRLEYLRNHPEVVKLFVTPNNSGSLYYYNSAHMLIATHDYIVYILRHIDAIKMPIIPNQKLKYLYSNPDLWKDTTDT